VLKGDPSPTRANFPSIGGCVRQIWALNAARQYEQGVASTVSDFRINRAKQQIQITLGAVTPKPTCSGGVTAAFLLFFQKNSLERNTLYKNCLSLR
jgi:hypothetical protein